MTSQNEQGDHPVTAGPKRGAKAKLWRWMGSLHLNDLPELGCFPDEQSRLIALDDIAGKKLGWVSRGRHFTIFMAINLLSLAVLRTHPFQLIFGPSFPRVFDFLASFLLLCVSVLIPFYYLHRRAVAAALRTRLLELGVPICQACGYDLRGLRPTSQTAPKCPECGKVLSPKVEQLLTASERPAQ